MLPYVVQYPLPEQFTVSSWEKAWEASGNHAFVLESGKSGKYSFLGIRPFSTIRGGESRAIIEEEDGAVHKLVGERPLDAVKAWMAPYVSPRVDGLPKFVGGIVGYWGYDVVRMIERLPTLAKADLPCPDYCFMMFDRIWVIDHEQHQLYCAVHQRIRTDDEDRTDEELRRLYGLAAKAADRMKVQWDQMMVDDAIAASSRAKASRLAEDYANNQLQIDVEALEGVYTEFSRDRYMSAVQQIQEYIRAGDVFQVNLSVRQSCKLDAKPEQIYEWLRYLNPSPYMGFLKLPDFQLVSASPELLVQLDGNRVRTRPIAGTRPRGANAEEDERIRRKLLDNEKERAEHIMLVDLERNDLGRISRYGTVRVDELMAIEYYSHVMHIVSEVTSELMPGKDVFDVIAAVFPGGTITGAPKIRTMEIIEELEPTRRGPYTGSMGWIDYNGNMEFNIIIRTLLAEGGIGHVQAGAGIVIDSDPAREYTESLNKAKALWKAVQYASLGGE